MHKHPRAIHRPKADRHRHGSTRNIPDGREGQASIATRAAGLAARARAPLAGRYVDLDNGHFQFPVRWCLIPIRPFSAGWLCSTYSKRSCSQHCQVLAAPHFEHGKPWGCMALDIILKMALLSACRLVLVLLQGTKIKLKAGAVAQENCVVHKHPHPIHKPKADRHRRSASSSSFS